MNIVIHQHTKTPSESVERLLEKLGINQVILHYGKAVDKITQYEFFEQGGIPHPEWSINVQTANNWLKFGHTVMARRFIKSGTGNGIDVYESGQISNPDDYKVYTKYIKKKREFRVNLFQHKLVNVREKVKVGEGSNYIRNVVNGWSTSHPTSNLPTGLADLACSASMVSDSDFIGVDVGYNETKNLLFVLEVNSGPSIEGSSVDDFTKAIKETF